MDYGTYIQRALVNSKGLVLSDSDAVENVRRVEKVVVT